MKKELKEIYYCEDCGFNINQNFYFYHNCVSVDLWVNHDEEIIRHEIVDNSAIDMDKVTCEECSNETEQISIKLEDYEKIKMLQEGDEYKKLNILFDLDNELNMSNLRTDEDKETLFNTLDDLIDYYI